jgi:N-acetylmuramoyl-L-alanine amidase
MRTIALILCVCLLPSAVFAADAEKGLAVKAIRYFTYPSFTRIVFETGAAAPYVLTRSGDGRTIYFSSFGAPFTPPASRPPVIQDGVVRQLDVREDRDQRAIIISLGPLAGEVKDFVLRGPDRIVVDITRGAPAAPAPDAPGARLPVVVLDPGHGGADPGAAVGQGAEKLFTLELAHAVRRALRQGGAQMMVLLTREQDAALAPDDRAAFANAAGADLFVSLHGAAGAERRVLILDPDEGQQLLPAGGAGDFLGFDSLNEQQLRWDAQQAGHAEESGRLGRVLARSLTGQEGGEPWQAPVGLLRPVNAAAALVEAGAAQNRTQTAEAIARGIERYVAERR